MLGRRHEGMRRAGLLGALVALGVMPYARAGGMPCFVGTARVGVRGARGPSCCPVLHQTRLPLDRFKDIRFK